jgi:hypothetical protein
MPPTGTVIDAQPVAPVPGPGAAPADLETLVAEIGASYPLVALTGSAGAGEDEDDETAAIDAMIMAGLVNP